MVLNEKINNALNDQINAEFYSAYLYLSMSAYFESISLPGFANWMYVQYQEELSHGLKLFRYINERGGRAVVNAIEKPKQDWSSVIEIFEDVLAHEQKVTNLINNLVDLSIAEKDHATNSMLMWFVDEQVEEEANASQLLDEVKALDGSKSNLYMLDKELSKRIFKDETQE